MAGVPIAEYFAVEIPDWGHRVEGSVSRVLAAV